jgi:hypothetical protein
VGASPIAPVPFGGHHPFLHGTAPQPQGTRTPSGRSAETLVLVALIFQALGAGFVLLFSLLFLPFWLFASFYVGSLFVAFIVGIGTITVLLLYVGYAFSYRRIQTGDYEGAGAATLLLGILLLLPTIIPGILYLIAYAKLGDATRERWGPMMNYGNPYAGPSGYSMGVMPGYPSMGAMPGYPSMGAMPGYPSTGAMPGSPSMCPRCGSPGAYIPLHQRYYCYSCRTYL